MLCVVRSPAFIGILSKDSRENGTKLSSANRNVRLEIIGPESHKSEGTSLHRILLNLLTLSSTRFILPLTGSWHLFRELSSEDFEHVIGYHLRQMPSESRSFWISFFERLDGGDVMFKCSVVRQLNFLVNNPLPQ